MTYGELFVPRVPADIPALIAVYPLAWVVSAGADGFHSTPLPLLAELDGEGVVRSLFGHFALANPQVAALRAAPAATFLFQGPQGYVSPRLVSQPAWGATWNYAAISFDGTVAFVPEENDAALQRLTAHMEQGAAQPWSPAEMGDRYDRLSQHIVAFRAHVGPARARFKLGQDERPATFAEITERHPDPALTDWMRRSRPQESR